jgi:hypothetical protein
VDPSQTASTLAAEPSDNDHDAADNATPAPTAPSAVRDDDKQTAWSAAAKLPARKPTPESPLTIDGFSRRRSGSVAPSQSQRSAWRLSFGTLRIQTCSETSSQQYLGPCRSTPRAGRIAVALTPQGSLVTLGRNYLAAGSGLVVLRQEPPPKLLIAASRTPPWLP